MELELDSYTKDGLIELLRQKLEEYDKSAKIQIALLEKAKKIRSDIHELQEYLRRYDKEK